MTKRLRAAFDLEPLKLSLNQILPTKVLHEAVKESSRYKTIAASVQEVGVIEPLIVYPKRGGKYMLLDGHVRLQVLRDLGQDAVLCLVASDDESFTYNNRISRLAPIQANRMILKALDAGVSEERLARALNVNVSTLRQRRSLLSDICAEAVDVLKDKPVTDAAIRCLKKVKPLRQIEIAEMMVASGSYTFAYADFLVMKTPPEQLAKMSSKGKKSVSRVGDVERVESDLKLLERDFKLLDETYGKNVFELTLARGYLKKLLDNGKVLRFLSQRYPELLPEFQKIVATMSLEG